MGAGLIQKVQRTESDFSTVFIFNLAISITIYLVLYFLAPSIAEFYGVLELIPIIRILGFTIIINALAIIPRTQFVINIDFRSLAKVNVLSTFVSGVFGIFFAFVGFGVWSLVIQSIVKSLVATISLLRLSMAKWSFGFSVNSFKELFGFGSKILISGILAQLWQNMYNVLIGKKYSSGDLGYFTQAKLFSDLASDTLTNVVQQVTFPILSSLQVDRDRLRQVYGRMLRLTAFIVFPTMILLALLADPLVRFFLTEKWLPTVVLLQWFALSRIFYPISSVNLNILNAVGRSDLFLKIDVSKLPIVLFVLLITLPLGIKAMVIGQFISSFIAFFINAYVPGKLLGYGLRRQLMDMIPSAIASILMSVVVMLLLSLFDNLLLKIFLGFTLGYTFYFFFSHVLKINELRDFIEFAQDGLKKLKN